MSRKKITTTPVKFTPVQAEKAARATLGYAKYTGLDPSQVDVILSALGCTALEFCAWYDGGSILRPEVFEHMPEDSGDYEKVDDAVRRLLGSELYQMGDKHGRLLEVLYGYLNISTMSSPCIDYSVFGKEVWAVARRVAEGKPAT